MAKLLFQADVNDLHRINERLRNSVTKTGTTVILGDKNREHLSNARQAISNALKELEQIE